MSNTYLVVRSDKLAIPCGMNAIICSTDLESKANFKFKHAAAGFDCWNKPNTSYYVLLVKWDADRKDYRIVKGKFNTADGCRYTVTF